MGSHSGIPPKPWNLAKKSMIAGPIDTLRDGDMTRRVAVGVVGLISSLAGVFCWFLPYSPHVMLFCVLGLQVTSLLLIISAGFLSSRWWFVGLVIPLCIIGMVPEYEQATEIALKGTCSDGIAFKLSGTFDIRGLYLSRYSAEIQEPNDPRFTVWQIEAADPATSKAAWELSTIKYGVVPVGYVQVFPAPGAHPSPLEPGKIYRLNADGFRGRYFAIVGDKPRWVETPPDAPCFKLETKWVRTPCV